MLKFTLIAFLCFSLGCSGVFPIGHYKTPEGKIITYVQSTATTPTGTTSLVTVDRFQYDPETKQTTLIRSDASGVPSGKPLDILKEIPLPIPIPF